MFEHLPEDASARLKRPCHPSSLLQRARNGSQQEQRQDRARNYSIDAEYSRHPVIGHNTSRVLARVQAGGDQLFDDGDGQRAFVEHGIVKLEYVEFFSGSSLIAFAKGEPFVQANVIRG